MRLSRVGFRCHLRLLHVQVLVHFLRVVVLNLILQMIQEEHLGLIQLLDDSFDVCVGSTLEVSGSTTVQLLRYLNHLGCS